MPQKMPTMCILCDRLTLRGITDLDSIHRCQLTNFRLQGMEESPTCNPLHKPYMGVEVFITLAGFIISKACPSAGTKRELSRGIS